MIISNIVRRRQQKKSDSMTNETTPFLRFYARIMTTRRPWLFAISRWDCVCDVMIVRLLLTQYSLNVGRPLIRLTWFGFIDLMKVLPKGFGLVGR